MSMTFRMEYEHDFFEFQEVTFLDSLLLRVADQ